MPRRPASKVSKLWLPNSDGKHIRSVYPLNSKNRLMQTWFSNVRMWKITRGKK